jgi:hypothetical protein
MLKILSSTIFIILTINAYAQTITRNEIDEATNTRVITTSPWNGTTPESYQGKHTIFPYLKYLKTEKGRGLYFLSFIVKTNKDIGCLMETAGNVLIEFTDNQKIALKQQSDTNCDYGYYKVAYYLVNTPQAQDVNLLEKMNRHYDMLSNKPIKKITIEGSDKTDSFTLSDEESEVILKHTKLLNQEMQEINDQSN